MKTYNSKDLINALAKVTINKADTILMHSSLFTLGHYESAELSEAPEEIVDAILGFLGESGTLAVPAFNFDFCEGAVFNRQNTPSKGMGVLSEAVRNWSGAKRSAHPIQSVSAVGKKSEWICEPDTSSSFSIGGPFERMFHLGAKFLFFGTVMQYAAFIHYIEERLEVPYRYWKSFKGLYIDQGKSEEREYKMFVRDRSLGPQLKLSILEDQMESNGQIRRAPLGCGQIYSCTFKDFYITALNMLEKDPFCLLENKEEVLLKFKKGISDVNRA